MPISGCHDLPLATFNLPSRVFRHGCRRAECLERRWGGFFHTLSRGQHMPPQRLPIQPQKNPPNQKPPRAVSPEAACVSDHSCGQHMLPQRLPVQPQKNPQNKKLKPLVLPLPRRHAWLAGPPANTCSRNKPSKQTATAPPLNLCRSQAGAAQRGLMPFIFGFVWGGRVSLRAVAGADRVPARWRRRFRMFSGCSGAAPAGMTMGWGGKGEKIRVFVL